MTETTMRPLAFLDNGGEMGELMRNMDWSTSVVGTPDTWPQSLRTAINLLLNSQFPMFVWWGKDLINFYNDAYRVIAGEKHPRLLGQSGRVGWLEIWPDLAPLVDSVFSGRSTWSEDQLLYINRRGFTEETYFTFSYSPIADESGSVAGLFCACIETTEKVLAARKILQSERNLRATILQAPIAMCILKGPDFVLDIANKRMYELWGHTEAELLHRPIFDGVPEARFQGLEELLQKVLTTGETITASERQVQLYRQGQPESRYLNLVYEPFREGDGGITGILSVATDVTEQVIARRRVEESEAILQQRVIERTADLEEQKTFIASILAASMDGIYALKAVRDTEGKITDFQYLFANTHIAKLLKLEMHQIIGSSMLTLIPENKGNGFFDAFCKVLETGETNRDETHFVTKNIEGWFSYAIVPIDEETLVVSLEDITQSKETAIQLEEQRTLLESILKNSSNGISVSRVFRDNKGKVVDALTILANDAAIKYIGLPKEIYLSKRATELEPNIIGSPYYQMCIKTLETGEPFLTQYQMESTCRWLELTVSKLDEDHLIQVFTDVTPIKEAQLQLERYVDDLKRSNQNLEDFAFAASHDLKEPIRKISTFMDRLKSSLATRLTETEAMMMERTLVSAKRMQSLVDDLLEFSHVSEQPRLMESVDLEEKVQRILQDLELLIEEKNAKVTTSNLPIVQGNRRQLQQLFYNLIGNALKYSKPGVPSVIHIHSRIVKGAETSFNIPADQHNKRFHLIEIIDNGIGFEQQYADKIFKMFQRLHGKAEYSGTGVGLAISRKVVENHGGYIWATSTFGEGATFHVLLPDS